MLQVYYSLQGSVFNMFGVLYLDMLQVYYSLQRGVINMFEGVSG